MSDGSCARCGTELAADRLSCPACHALVHAEALQGLVQEARAHESANDFAAALVAWQRALPLLPHASRQRDQIAAHVGELLRRRAGREPEVAARLDASGTRRGVLATAGAAALALIGKGKFLLLGLTKAGTLLTMLLSFGVYWTAFGWPFAAGLVVSIYIHEMGHMWALRRFGVKTGVPMFLPGVGAMIRLQQHFATAAEDARVGLAGPLWGLGAALAAYGAFLLSGLPIWAAIATTGAWINLFNLLPVWQLDGSRAFRALDRTERWLAVATLAAAFVLTRERLLLLVGIAAVWRAFERGLPAAGDRAMLLLYAGLVVALAVLAWLPVPHAGAVLR